MNTVSTGGSNIAYQPVCCNVFHDDDNDETMASKGEAAAEEEEWGEEDSQHSDNGDSFEVCRELSEEMPEVNDGEASYKELVDVCMIKLQLF